MKQENKDSFFLSILKYVFPPFILVGALVVAVIIVKSKHKPEETEIERMIPEVQVFQVTEDSIRLDVESQGSVVPRVETMLTAEVNGTVEWVSPALYAGGFFKKGDLLIKIEDIDYIASVANAKSVLARMKLMYEQELALSAQAKQDWEDMGEGSPTELVLRKPQLEKARADVEFAEATLRVAEKNLNRTEVHAPYDGRVRSKFVDVGQKVSPNMTQLASIYSVDSVEIRLALDSKEVGFVQLPELYVNTDEEMDKPVVKIIGEYGGQYHSWDGYLDRTEGVIDPHTRLVYAVAKVDDPYAKNAEDNRPPLKVGMFVKAIIQGEQLEHAFRIPGGALKPGNRIHVLNAENSLEIREVSVAKRSMQTVVVSQGLEDGDRVVLTPLQAVIEGMELKAVD